MKEHDQEEEEISDTKTVKSDDDTKNEKDKASKETKTTFLDRHPRIKRIFNFFKHPTIWRLATIAVATVLTILSGGGAIPLIVLAATTATAMIGVIGKTRQLFSLEKIKWQNSLTKVIEKRHNDLQSLKKTNQKAFEVLEQGPLKRSADHHFIKDVKQPSRKATVARVLRDIGAENFWTVAMFAVGGNVIGTVGYAASIALGIYTVKSEYHDRVAEEQHKEEMKVEINERCQKANISPYKSEKGLYRQFKERMIEYETTKLLCAENVDGKTDRQILERYEELKKVVEQKIKFESIPEEISLGRNVVHAINPFKEQNKVRSFDIEPEDAGKYMGVSTLKPEAFSAHKQHVPEPTPPLPKEQSRKR